MKIAGTTGDADAAHGTATDPSHGSADHGCLGAARDTSHGTSNDASHGTWNDALHAIASARCANCGAPIAGRYCAACGQATALHPPTVFEFMHEFLGHYIALEGPLWRTLGALLTPGRLTVDYFVGRRARYIPPLRLYLTVSLILFAVSGFNEKGLTLGSESVQFKLPQEASDDDFVIGPRVQAGQKTGIDFVDRGLARIEALTPAERSARIDGGVRHYLPYVLIVLVPVLALYLKLLYWNRHRLYGEHLVVAVHAQTVAFLFALCSAIPIDGWFGPLVLAALVPHGWLALKRVYGGGGFGTLVREGVLLSCYGVTVAIALAILVTTSLAMSH